MAASKIILLVINLVGGTAVIGSYIWGISSHQQGANALWGGIPTSTRSLYTVSMLLSAIGYFAFIYYTLFQMDSVNVKIAGTLNYSLLYAIFIFILLPSILWMPLTFSYLVNHSQITWIAVRVVLVLVAIGSISLVWALLSLQPRPSGLAYWLAVVGASYFAFHTTVLDALLWPVLFRK